MRSVSTNDFFQVQTIKLAGREGDPTVYEEAEGNRANRPLLSIIKYVLCRAPTRSEIRTFGPNSDHFGKWSKFGLFLENGPKML